VLTTLLEDVLFDLPDEKAGRILMDGAVVRERLQRVVEDEDLRKYIL
jgi:ATP-dependent HslUV protease ATP-binding subunit HslU